MNKIVKFSLLIILPFIIYCQFIAFLFLNFALKDNVHMMTSAEEKRFYLNKKMTNEKFRSFEKTIYLNLYRKTNKVDSVIYYYKLMDSIYKFESTHHFLEK